MRQGAVGDMSLLVPFIVIIAAAFILAAFFWIWWALPKEQVPPHFEKGELERVALQDRLRQTNLQILIAIGITAVVVLFVIQLSLSSRQWSSDFELRASQERLSRFVDGLKLIPVGEPADIAGIG